MISRVEQHIPLVKHIAGRIGVGLPRSVDFGDLINAGVLGLAEADKNYDDSLSVKFESYAAFRIRGAILDELRTADHAPRSLRSNMRKIFEAVRICQTRLLRDPTVQEVADEAHMAPGTVHAILRDTDNAITHSADEIVYLPKQVDNVGVPRIEILADDTPSPLDDAERHDTHDALMKALTLLPDQERTVIAFYYLEGMTMSQIAEILELSESRISQIHTGAIAKLRRLFRIHYAHNYPVLGD